MTASPLFIVTAITYLPAQKHSIWGTLHLLSSINGPKVIFQFVSSRHHCSAILAVKGLFKMIWLHVGSEPFFLSQPENPNSIMVSEKVYGRKFFIRINNLFPL